jgi:hypothetical protein
LPLLSLALPAWRVTWLPEIPAGQATIVTTGDQPKPNLSRVAGPLVLPAPVVMPIAEPAVAANDPASPEKPQQTIRASGVSLLSWVVPIWLIGLVAFVPLAVGLWQLTSLRARSSAVHEPDWLTLVDELRGQLRLRRRVQLRQCETSGRVEPVAITYPLRFQDYRRRPEGVGPAASIAHAYPCPCPGGG